MRRPGDAIRRARWVLGGLVSCAALVGLNASPAFAAFPGTNGLIAFGHGVMVATLDPRTGTIVDLVGGQGPAWSADGKRIAFEGGFGLTAPGIYVMKADGSGLTQLTFRTTLEPDEFPSWSPDGKRIVFDRCSFDTGQGCDIYTMRSDGTGVVQLTHDGLSEGPVYSPDGALIAFDSTSTGNSEIYSMDTHGGNVTQLTAGTTSQLGADWSPDGSKIVFFTTNVVGSHGDIWVMNADGSNPVNITHTAIGDEEYPAWSPDGTQITFHKNREHHPTQIYVMNADGTGVVRLTGDPIPGDTAPDWQAVP